MIAAARRIILVSQPLTSTAERAPPKSPQALSLESVHSKEFLGLNAPRSPAACGPPYF